MCRDNVVHSLPGESIPWNDDGTRLSPPGSIPLDADRYPDRRRFRIACPPGAPAQSEAHALASGFWRAGLNVKVIEIALHTDLDSHIVVN